VYGLSTLTISISASLSAVGIGLLYDRFGNYNVAVGRAAAMFVIRQSFTPAWAARPFAQRTRPSANAWFAL